MQLIAARRVRGDRLCQPPTEEFAQMFDARPAPGSRLQVRLRHDVKMLAGSPPVQGGSQAVDSCIRALSCDLWMAATCGLPDQ
jgi:hypothetical protein